MDAQVTVGPHREHTELVCLNSCEHDEPEGKIYECSKEQIVQVPSLKPQPMLHNRTVILGLPE